VAAEALGARELADPSLSASPFNAFSCATCHAVVAPSDASDPAARRAGPLYPGYNLFDVVHRGSWWGGYETRLLDAINACMTNFMGGAPLSADDPRARAIYEYLATVSPDSPSPPFPLTVVKNITDLAPGGDAGRGHDLYDRGCATCHGTPHTGEGRLGSKSSIIPEDTLNGPVCARAPDPHACTRTVVIEKIRHGRFFNIGGLMPLYSVEALADTEIVDLLAYLGL
jgi:thiosulfate dehydrogenase